MDISSRGVEALAIREGVILGAYNDSQNHCTSCIGKLLHYGPCTKADYDAWRGVSRARCFEEFNRDLGYYVSAVNRGLRVLVSQNQFDALVSITYNIGVGQKGFAGSTFLRLINEGRLAEVGAAILLWNKPPEILGRRRSEVTQFYTPDPPGPRKDPVMAFALMNMNSLLVIDLAGHPTKAEAGWAVGQASLDCGLDQAYEWAHGSPDGSVAIRLTGTDLVLTATSRAPQSPIVLWPYHNGENQRWFVRSASTTVVIESAMDRSLVLEIPNARREPDAPVVLHPYNGHPTQTWTAPPIEARPFD